MRHWKVAGGLVTSELGTLLVANRRRDGRVDWSTPGGVVDEGETSLAALSREVLEETGLEIEHWSRLCWTTEVDFVDLEMHLAVEVHMAGTYDGAIAVDDPDGIVIEACFLGHDEIHERLDSSPAWVAEPMRAWLTAPWDQPRHFGYRALGRSLTAMSAERIAE